MMTEREAYALGEQIAGDLPIAEEVSLVRDEWTGEYAIYISVHGHEAFITERRMWPTPVFTIWLTQRCSP